MASKQKCLRSTGIAEELDANIGFALLERFPSEQLPVLGEVIGHILQLIDNHQSNSYEDAIHKCAETLEKYWTNRNIYLTYLQDIKRKLKKEVDEFRKLKRTAENKRSDSRKPKVKTFVERWKQLFDIFCENDKRRKQLETDHGVTMQQLEWDYLASMRSDRKGRCTSVDTQWQTEQESVSKRKKRDERQNMNSTMVSSTKLIWMMINSRKHFLTKISQKM